MDAGLITGRKIERYIILASSPGLNKPARSKDVSDVGIRGSESFHSFHRTFELIFSCISFHCNAIFFKAK